MTLANPAEFPGVFCFGGFIFAGPRENITEFFDQVLYSAIRTTFYSLPYFMGLAL